MKIVAITGAPSIGKTTVGEGLLKVLGKPCAFIDGDSVAVYLPVDLADRDQIVLENFCSCAPNFAQAGVEVLVVTHVFTHELVSEIRERMHSLGYPVLVIGLVAEDDTLLRRDCERYPGESRNPEQTQRLLHNNAMTRSTPGARLVDTSHMDLGEAVSAVADLARDCSLYS